MRFIELTLMMAIIAVRCNTHIGITPRRRSYSPGHQQYHCRHRNSVHTCALSHPCHERIPIVFQSIHTTRQMVERPLDMSNRVHDKPKLCCLETALPLSFLCWVCRMGVWVCFGWPKMGTLNMYEKMCRVNWFVKRSQLKIRRNELFFSAVLLFCDGIGLRSSPKMRTKQKSKNT